MKNDIWKMINGKSFPRSVPITHQLFMEAMKGVEPLSSGLQDRRSIIQLSYIAKVAQTEVCATFGGLGGIQTLAGSLQYFYAVVTSPARGIEFQVSHSKFQVHLLVTSDLKPET